MIALLKDGSLSSPTSRTAGTTSYWVAPAGQSSHTGNYDVLSVIGADEKASVLFTAGKTIHAIGGLVGGLTGKSLKQPPGGVNDADFSSVSSTSSTPRHGQ
jgi:hypothetical protein